MRLKNEEGAEPSNEHESRSTFEVQKKYPSWDFEIISYFDSTYDEFINPSVRRSWPKIIDTLRLKPEPAFGSG